MICLYIRPNNEGCSAQAFIPAQKLYEKEGAILTTDKCYRCFGGMIFLVRKNDEDWLVPQVAVIVFHMLPGNRKNIRYQRKILLKYINDRLEYFNAVTIVRCGGRMLSKQDHFYFKEMRNKIEGGLKRMFPDVFIDGIYPNTKTYYTEMTLVNHWGGSLEVQFTTQEVQ